jgi:hypothetical protein
VDAPERGTELQIRYLSAEPIQPAPEAFRLVIPPGVRVDRLD